MQRVRISLIVLLVLMFLVSCATFTKNTYVVLNESKDLYTIGMTVVADLQKQGKITVAQRENINKYAKIYKEAHNLAVDALATYKTTSSAADKDKVIIALADAASKWGQVAALINAIKPGTIQSTFTK